MNRRYIFNQTLSESHKNRPVDGYDAVIVGGGMAGLYAALQLKRDLRVAIVVKGDLSGGSSYLAQGGICCVLGEDDSFEEHIEDTLAAGAGHCDRAAVEVLVREAPENIRTLIEYGVPFDRNADGSLHITREGGHRKNRIIHCGGDATGKQVTETLGKLCEQRENITVLWNHNLVDILTDAEGVCGVVLNDGKTDLVLRCPQVIVATGGAGQVYRYSTTPSGNTGEGIAACFRAGCTVKDMEFVQFHPTAFAVHKEGERVFLISEAVRGEGAILRNKNGEAFMSFPYQHPQHDLAPRDIVTRAILAELRRIGGDTVYLDASCMTRAFFEERFPTITETCKKAGVCPPDDFIPVHPTQHYMMGGVAVDLDGRTNVDGLYVCGEAACTGVHGANRLASNSTLECLVFGRRTARAVNAAPRPLKNTVALPEVHYDRQTNDEQALHDMAALKSLMTEKVGAERRMNELDRAQAFLSDMKQRYIDCNFTDEVEYALFGAIDAALLIVEGARARHESLGAHYLVKE